jgi:hypothetical protein
VIFSYACHRVFSIKCVLPVILYVLYGCGQHMPEHSLLISSISAYVSKGQSLTSHECLRTKQRGRAHVRSANQIHMHEGPAVGCPATAVWTFELRSNWSKICNNLSYIHPDDHSRSKRPSTISERDSLVFCIFFKLIYIIIIIIFSATDNCFTPDCET